MEITHCQKKFEILGTLCEIAQRPDGLYARKKKSDHFRPVKWIKIDIHVFSIHTHTIVERSMMA